MKKYPFWIGVVLGAFLGVLAVLYFGYLPASNELEQYKLALYTVERVQTTGQFLGAYPCQEGKRDIAKGSVALDFTGRRIYAISPDRKVTRHQENGRLVEQLDIKLPDAIIRMETVEFGPSQSCK
ncbi:MAG: hypothetical protein WC831_05225 [Parcubacteria group bacterium]|jgi:hypothetical protein